MPECAVFWIQSSFKITSKNGKNAQVESRKIWLASFEQKPNEKHWLFRIRGHILFRDSLIIFKQLFNQNVFHTVYHLKRKLSSQKSFARENQVAGKNFTSLFFWFLPNIEIIMMTDMKRRVWPLAFKPLISHTLQTRKSFIIIYYRHYLTNRKNIMYIPSVKKIAELEAVEAGLFVSHITFFKENFWNE